MDCPCLPKRSFWRRMFSTGRPRVAYCSVSGRHIKDFPKIMTLGATSLTEVESEEFIWLHGLDYGPLG